MKVCKAEGIVLEYLKLKLVDISEVDSRTAMVAEDGKSSLMDSVDLMSSAATSDLSMLRGRDNPLNQSIITVSRK